MYRSLFSTAAIVALAAFGSGCAGMSGSGTGNATAKTAATKPGDPVAASASAGTGQTPVNAFTSTNLEDQIRSAQALREKGDIAGAVKAFAQLVLIAPDDARVVGEYGKCLVQQGRSADAVAFLKRATQINQNDAAVYSALGVAYDQLDDRKNAAAAYDRALLLHPGDPNVLNNYAVSRMLAGDLNGAQKLLMQAQASGANNPKIASNLQLLAQMRANPAAAKAVAGASHGVGPQTSGSVASSQPKGIVMQPRPANSSKLAESAKAAHKKTTAASKTPKPTKTAAKKIAPPPTLRTADQGE
jgi:Flp pilus assembly protein TadD